MIQTDEARQLADELDQCARDWTAAQTTLGAIEVFRRLFVLAAKSSQHITDLAAEVDTLRAERSKWTFVSKPEIPE